MAGPNLPTSITAGVTTGHATNHVTTHQYINKFDTTVLSGLADGDTLIYDDTTSTLKPGQVAAGIADRAHTPYVCQYNGTSYDAPPNDVPAGLAYYDSFGYPGAPAPAYGATRPSALDGDKWFPDPDAT